MTTTSEYLTVTHTPIILLVIFQDKVMVYTKLYLGNKNNWGHNLSWVSRAWCQHVE